MQDVRKVSTKKKRFGWVVVHEKYGRNKDGVEMKMFRPIFGDFGEFYQPGVWYEAYQRNDQNHRIEIDYTPVFHIFPKKKDAQSLKDITGGSVVKVEADKIIYSGMYKLPWIPKRVIVKCFGALKRKIL
jgi:hypothetical protein